jgi:hypothetical protein
MFKTSSDNESKSKRPQTDGTNHDTSNAEEQSDYYYDDATGYEIYEGDEEEDDSGERQKDLCASVSSSWTLW